MDGLEETMRSTTLANALQPLMLGFMRNYNNIVAILHEDVGKLHQGNEVAESKTRVQNHSIIHGLFGDRRGCQALAINDVICGECLLGKTLIEHPDL